MEKLLDLLKHMRGRSDLNFNVKSSYSLAALRAFDDRDFIDQAYRVILARPPDPSGFDNFLTSLRTGKLSKVEIIARLRFSPEGRGVGVRIFGLLPSLAATLAGRLPRYALARIIGQGPHLPSPLNPPDSVAHAQLAMLMDRTAEHGSVIEMLRGLPEGLRELRRSEQALRREVEQLKKELETLKHRQ